ncbi:MAG: hypothetical protein AB7F41_07850 [Methylocystis sp.]|uniref:hypothetical protein n=1 Tax=Methylocystis sp. TaxID=1911079 RepID=UPI003D10CB4F
MAIAIACLLFQQALGLIFSHAHHAGDFGAFVTSPFATSYELCVDQGGDGKARHVQHMHCTACFLSEQSNDFFAKDLLSAIIVVLVPQADDSPIWLEQRDLAPSAEQWPSNGLSRAPPSRLS